MEKKIFSNKLLAFITSLCKFICILEYWRSVKIVLTILCVVDFATKWPPMWIPKSADPWISYKIFWVFVSFTQLNNNSLCGREKYPRLDIWKLQDESSYVHGIQDYEDIFEIANSKLYLDNKDVLLDLHFSVQQGKMQTKHPRHFQKKHLV